MPSVIIPAHNEEAMIERVIRSVLADGIEDLECVVVPNACTDRTAEIARMLGGERLSSTSLAHAQEMLELSAKGAPVGASAGKSPNASSNASPNRKVKP